MENPTNSQPPEATGVPPLATGSAPSEKIGIGGVKIRLIPRDRLLASRENIANQHGQFLWKIVGFCPSGVRLTQWPHGVLSDHSWENFYATFYERVPNAAYQPRGNSTTEHE